MDNLIISLILVIGTMYLYYLHHQPEYTGDYNEDNVYKNISPLKFDMFRIMTLQMFPLFIYGFSSDGPFYNPDDFLNSKIGKITVSIFSMVVFYNIMQPYVSNKLPYW